MNPSFLCSQSRSGVAGPFFLYAKLKTKFAVSDERIFFLNFGINVFILLSFFTKLCQHTYELVQKFETWPQKNSLLAGRSLGLVC